MDIREKLEILRHKLAGMISAAMEPCAEGECCESCKYFRSTACTDYLIADFLIAHDVTVPEQGSPLTLEELRLMDGCPVWVEVIDHSVFADKADDFDGWGLVRKSWVRVLDEKRADLVMVDYHFEDYGKEWQAYSQPPKGE